MKRAAFGLLCLFFLVPVAAFAQSSITSFGPTSFYSFEFEQNATIHGVDLFGDFYGAPNSENIFLSTQLVVSGPAGTFTEDISGGFREINTLNDTIFMAIPDSTLLVEGHYSVTVIAHDDTGDRSIGPVFYDVVARPVVGQPPVLSYPEIVVGEADSATGGHPTFEVTSFSYVDPTPPPVNCNHVSGSFFPLGDTTVTCTATDSFGTATASFLVEVTDTVAPIVNVPANIISTTPVVTFTVTATDAVSGSITVTCSPASGSTFNAGTTTVTCEATDSHANTGFGTFKVTVTGGANAPIITVPSDITAEASGPGGTNVAFVVTATDNASIICAPASGSLFALGTTTVTCAATSSGGTSSDSFNVNVVDTLPPVLSLPGTINAGATSPAGAVVTYSATATDLVDGFFLAGCDHPSGSVFPIGTTSVACSATDNALNTASGGFLVIVTEDVTPPVLSLPADITAEATGPTGAVVTYTATANDNLDGPVPVTCVPPSGSTFPLGVTTVQCSASDAHGNIATGSFTITVRDTTPPTIVSITASPSNLWPANHNMTDVTVTVIATDLVDPAPTSHIVSVSSNQADNENGDGNTTTDWIITGMLTLQLRAERDGNSDRIYTITIASTDSSGNTSIGTVTVSVSPTSHGGAQVSAPSIGRSHAVRP
jgi:hypothetical protein